MSEFDFANNVSEVMTEIIVDCATGETTERQLSETEVAERKAQAEAFAAEQAAREAEAAQKKAEAESKLAALGLTADDLKALLG